MSHFVITGAKGGTTQGAAAPNRLEINDLIKNREQFSLYIQALVRVHATPQSQSISHFSIGGIHGLPYVPWEGAGGTRPVSGSQWGGYCTHGSVLFPTWHRPYVALYEQVLQQHALDIAKTYQDQQHWTSVAQNLRAPYWDWATNSVPPPEVVSLTTVNITTPDGKMTSVENPLIKYTFNPIDPSFPSPYKSWKTTIRHPDNPNSPTATTDVQGLKDDLTSIQQDVTSSIYRLLSRVHTWPAFSNHTSGDGGSASNSLEAIHDEIHGIIGGQMGNPAVAGFDPIFFLHHCNVDRLLSLWSALNPGVWVSSGPAEGGTWTISGNDTIDNKTNLTPFWNSQSGFWASSGTMATSSLNYSYPEFNNLNLGNAEAAQRAIASYVNQHYGGGEFSVLESITPTPGVNLLAQPPAQPPASDAPAVAAQGASSVTAALSSVKSAVAGVIHHAQEGVHAAAGIIHYVQKHVHAALIAAHLESDSPTVIYDWSVRIHAKKYELGHGYIVLIFLGQVPNDPSQWRTSPSFVGAHVAFVNTEAEHCDNCREQAELVVEGFVHLNAAISKLSGLSSFDPSVVAPYLRDNLHWRVQAADRSAVPLEKLTSLEVTAVSNTLTHEAGALFPIAGPAKLHPHITHGRLGGARQAQA